MKKLWYVGVGLLAWLGVPSAGMAQTSCSVVSQGTLLNNFADNVPNGSIVPSMLRNFVCSVPSLAGGGGGGTPGGAANSVQFNNSGAFGGVSLGTNQILLGSSGSPGASTLSAAIDAAIGSTRGSLLERGASGWALITPGTSGQVLTSGGSGADPTYQTVTGTGTVTSVAMTVPSYLTVSGSPITGAGTLAVSLSGTALPLTSGGTGATSFTANALVKGAGTSPLAASSVVDNGSGVVIGAATGGAQGPGTLNMTGCYINGVLCSSGGGGGSLTITDGSHTVAGTTNISFGNGLTVGGATPNGTIIGTLYTAATPDIVVSGSTIGTTIPANSQSGSSYAILTGDNTKTILMTNVSATSMTVPVAGSTGFAAGWGVNVIPTLAGTTITPASGTLCEQSSITLAAGQLLSFGTGAGTDYVCGLALPTSGAQNLVIATPNGSTGQPRLRALVGADIPAINLATGVTGTLPNASVAAAPLPTPGSGATLVAPRSYYVCTTTCSVTLPTPAAGYEFCVRNDNNVTTVITFVGISGVQFENTNFTSYKSAAASIVSAGAAGDKLCVMGRDATHYLVMSFNGTWS